jgi:hypothetical protein
MTPSYPHLEELVGGYFHQDWRDDAPTAAAILERYLNEWPAEDAALALGELRALLRLADDKVEQAVAAMGSYYNPVADGLSYRGWLTQMADRLNEHVASRLRP